MSDTITVRGYVATDVRSTTAESGLAVAGFRICTNERRYNRDAGTWYDGQTNWYAISCFRQLATNAGVSIHKGDRVIVTGRLKVRQWVADDGRSGTSVDIDADSVGHDLMWGTAHYRRNLQERTAASAASEEDSGTEDLPADLDLETGELVGTDSAEGVPAETSGGPDDPFVVTAVAGPGHGRMGG